MLRLTKAGKIVFALGTLLLCGLIYFLFFKPEGAPPTDAQGIPFSSPAADPPKPFKFPLSDDQAALWAQQSEKNRAVLKHCSFFKDYPASRDKGGIKLDFVGIVPEDAAESPYYRQDPETGRFYAPVYPVGAGTEGVNQALAAYGGDPKGVDPCVVGPDGAPTPVVVVWPKGQNPPTQGGLVRVLGYMAWQFGFIKAEVPDQAATVVNAGRIEDASLQQALAPAIRQRVLNILVKRGPVWLRLGRIEFAATQTRLWTTLWNTSSEAVSGYGGVTRATIREAGKAEQKAGPIKLTGTQSLSKLEKNGDLLSSTDIPPPSVNTGGLSGYITFPPVDPSRVLILDLPDPYAGSGGANDKAISIQLRPQQNKEL